MSNPSTPESPTFPVLPLSRKRKILFVYEEPTDSRQSFEWCESNLFRPGQDYVCLFAIDPNANKFMDTSLFWTAASEDYEVEDSERDKIKKETFVEKELEAIKIKLSAKNIPCQKLQSLNGDPKTLILKQAENMLADLIVVPPSHPNYFSKTVFGTLEDYIVKNAPCTVVVPKPKAYETKNPATVTSAPAPSRQTSAPAPAQESVIRLPSSADESKFDIV